MQPEDITWEKLDKFKFYTYGSGIFTAVAACLYPLRVIKTKQIATPTVPPNFQGLRLVVSEMWRNEGIRGFYKGFGTTCFGNIPSRTVYMSTLEIVKNGFSNSIYHFGLSEVALSGSISFVAGATASLASQVVYVPIDVISQRLMVLNSVKGASIGSVNGLVMGRMIIQNEGVMALWKGLFASIGTLVPHSAIWWAGYASYQKQIWRNINWLREGHSHQLGYQADTKQDNTVVHKKSEKQASLNEIVIVQVSSAALAGVTTAFLTNPLDVIKTRTQLQVYSKGAKRYGSLEICKQIFKEEGFYGFLRGLAPRTASVIMWGTCMVTAYEFLKRAAAL